MNKTDEQERLDKFRKAEETLHRMNMHEGICISTMEEAACYVRRVPSGWIYTQYEVNGLGGATSVFVPE